jgi:PAS domain S-box-containing protein
MAKIFVLTGPLEGESFELEKDITRVGRGSDCDIQINHPSVSRNHAIISRKENRYFIVDLESHNGIRVFDHLVSSGESFELEEGLPIALGDVVLTLGEERLEKGIVTQYSIDISKQVAEGKGPYFLSDRRLTHRRNLEMIHEVSTVLMESLDIKEIGRRIIDSLFSCLPRIDCGTLLLADEKTGELREIATETRGPEKPQERPYSRTIVNRVFNEGKALMMADTSLADRNDLSDSIEMLRIRSIMCVPLISKSKTHGVIYVHSVDQAYGFRKDDLSLITGLSSPAALAIENALLYSARRRAEKKLQKTLDQLEARVQERTRALARANRDLRTEVQERKRAEDKLRESEQQYRSLVENTLEGFFMCEVPSGRFLFLNQGICDLFGYGALATSERTIWDALSESDHPRARARLQACLQGESVRSEGDIYTAVKPDGSTFRIDVSASLLTLRGETVLQGIVRDVTRQEDLQRQLQHAQKMESIGTITSGVAHNFRNILAGISVNSQLLQSRYQEDPQLQKIAGGILEAVRRGSRLIDGLTQFSRREAKSDLEILNLTDLIKEAYELISKSFDKMIRIHVDARGQIPIMGDHSGLSQVLMNLCTNARDAMPGGGELRIRAIKRGHRAIITVSDTGEGMDKETFEKCFDPFFTTKAVDKGTGLGLSTAYGIVREHGGDIHVYAEPGRGTTFRLYFPLALSTAPAEQRPSEALARGRRQKILVVDDEIEMLEAMVELLHELGYRTRAATTGEDAIEQYRSWEPNAVLLDRNMPEMDGVTAAKEIIRNDPSAKIILMSGYEDVGPNGIDEDTRSIIKGYLTKPLEISTLSQVLATLIE